MYIRRARPFAPALFVICALSTSAGSAAGQSHDDHAMAMTAPPHKPTPRESAFAREVRDVTEPFKSATTIAGPGAGYALAFGCVSGGDFGAMGLHYVNMALVEDGEVDVTRPEIILYEPTPWGGIRITGADYLVYADQWDAKLEHAGPPQLRGQLFHRFESPNRFGLPAFYTLHVWAWKNNPAGTFTNWNPDVSCDGFFVPGQE